MTKEFYIENVMRDECEGRQEFVNRVEKLCQDAYPQEDGYDIKSVSFTEYNAMISYYWTDEN